MKRARRFFVGVLFCGADCDWCASWVLNRAAKDVSRTYGAPKLSFLVNPALTRWANLCRASGAVGGSTRAFPMRVLAVCNVIAMVAEKLRKESGTVRLELPSLRVRVQTCLSFRRPQFRRSIDIDC